MTLTETTDKCESVHSTGRHLNEHSLMNHTDEVSALRSKLATLEQLLGVHEQAVFTEAKRRAAVEAQLLEQQEVLARKNEALLASEREKSEMLERLRISVEELSTPILEVWEDVLALPVIGVVDSRRASIMIERLLDEIVRKQSRFVILDITGVEVVDTATADHLIRLVKAVELLGARCMVTGIRPAVAQTLVAIGADLGSLATLRNLRHALRECLQFFESDRERATRLPRR